MKRIAAVVLPRLACEVARQRRGTAGRGALAVIVEPMKSDELPAAAVIDAVDEEARRAGVRPGMRVPEASAMIAGLVIERVTHAEIEAALGRMAEIAMPLAPLISIRLESPSTSDADVSWGSLRRDTVWLDVTGAAHLVGGEEALADELVQRAESLGHAARVAFAEGPRIAEALARFAPADARTPSASRGDGARALAPLPIAALPIDSETVGWFLRLGLVTVGDLARLPRAALAARIPSLASLVIDLLAGRDATPLVPFMPPRLLVEEMNFDDGVDSIEALLFVLRGMTSRMAVRLGARGEACGRLELEFTLDRSIAELRRVVPRIDLAIDLPAPLSAETDLLRALRARLERVELGAPVVAMRLVIPAIARALRVQLDLSRGSAVNPDALPTLLAELSAEIGEGSVGVLTIVAAHAPEARSALVRPDLGVDKSSLAAPAMGDLVASVTRLLPVPVPLGEIGLRRIVAVDQALYAVEPKRFVMRLDDVGWWTTSPITRDYMTAWFVSGECDRDRGRGRGGSPPPVTGEGLVYVHRSTGEAFLQGWLE